MSPAVVHLIPTAPLAAAPATKLPPVADVGPELRIRALPSVGTAVRVAALGEDDEALLVLEIPLAKFDADRVADVLERAIDTLGLGQVMRPRLVKPER